MNDEMRALSETNPEYKWPRQVLDFIKGMRATVVASKVQDINTALGERVSLDISMADKDDVQKRTFKYLSDFFWTNVSTHKRQEVATAKLRHDSIRLS